LLVRRLLAEGETVRCLVRPETDAGTLEQLGAEVVRGDFEASEGIGGALGGARIVLHLASIRYVRSVLESVDKTIERLVLVSSLRRFSLVPDPTVDEVVAAEALVLESQLPWVLLRPSMIYGPGDDRNISRLATGLRRRRILPIPGQGCYLHQPVYVEDVVAAILAAAAKPGIDHRSYALAGLEPLSYDALVDAVGAAIGVRPFKIHLPLWLVLCGLGAARGLGLRPAVDRAQVLRLQEDKAYSIAEAQTDLAYVPLAFAAGLNRIYGG
jgi:nucleoside-diphosphate-sugar epimerase